MKTYSAVLALLGCSIISLLSACDKKYLDASPNSSLAVPETLSDLQSLLDNNSVINSQPDLAEISADNYFVTDQTYKSFGSYVAANCYMWNPNTYANGSGVTVAEWNGPYASIYAANVVLQSLQNVSLKSVSPAAWNYIMGESLFVRAFNFYNLSQIFAMPYVPGTAAADLGIPLRLSSNLDAIVGRASVKDTYSQIVGDLKEAAPLLPTSIPPSNEINRASRPAAYALLARVYLLMQQYDSALSYADSCLALYNVLIDYNTVSQTPTPTYGFSVTSPEVIMQSYSNFYLPFALVADRVDTNLYASYNANDIRQKAFFKASSAAGYYYFRGNYTGAGSPFDGFAVDEVYLIRAECSARLGDTSSAMKFLNNLLIKRWKTGTFTPITATSATDALTKVLTERRKELCFRSLRWGDLRRLNQDPAFAVTLNRTVNGTTYTLPPNDDRYTLLIPLDEVQLTGVKQTLR